MKASREAVRTFWKYNLVEDGDGTILALVRVDAVISDWKLSVEKALLLVECCIDAKT